MGWWIIIILVGLAFLGWLSTLGPIGIGSIVLLIVCAIIVLLFPK